MGRRTVRRVPSLEVYAMLRSRTLLFVMVGIGAFVSGCAAPTHTAEEVVEESFFPTEAPTVSLEVFNGPVDVVMDGGMILKVKLFKRGYGGSEAEAIEQLDKIDTSIEAVGQNVYRIAASRADKALGGNSRVTAELHVPENSNLTLKTSNGRIAVTGKVGSVKAQTTNGEISVKQTLGPIQAETSNGPIQIDEGQGSLDLKTTNGRIDIKATQAVVKARTTNGRIVLHGSLAPGEQEFTTTNGAIALNLAKGSRFRVDASTSNGRVTCGFQMTSQEKNSRTALRASVGSSPPTTMKLKTSNSNIEIKELAD